MRTTRCRVEELLVMLFTFKYRPVKLVCSSRTEEVINTTLPSVYTRHSGASELWDRDEFGRIGDTPVCTGIIPRGVVEVQY